MVRINTIATWNGYVGRPGQAYARSLAQWLPKYEPELANLQEAARALRFLRPVCRDLGYSIHRRAVLGVEGRSTLLLVRHDVPLHAKGAVVDNTPWIGPKAGIRHPGRVHPTVKAGDVPIRDLSVHMPPGQERNAKAYRSNLNTIEHRADGWTVPFVLMGDWNGRHSQRGPHSPRALADALHADVVHDGRRARLDFALVRGFADASYEAHGKRGSDDHRVGILHLAY